MKLNLGCGTDIREGYTNVDMVNNYGIDIVHDLNKYPYPIKEHSCNKILALGIFEHLEDPKGFIEELYRISDDYCKIIIDTCHFSSWASWGDITHKRPFNSTSLNHVKEGRKMNTSLLNNNEIVFRVKPYLNVFPLFNKIININNATRCIYERSIIKYIFPVKNLIFTLNAVKDF